MPDTPGHHTKATLGTPTWLKIVQMCCHEATNPAASKSCEWDFGKFISQHSRRRTGFPKERRACANAVILASSAPEVTAMDDVHPQSTMGIDPLVEIAVMLEIGAGFLNEENTWSMPR